jgi:hypothetical protein
MGITWRWFFVEREIIKALLSKVQSTAQKCNVGRRKLEGR